MTISVSATELAKLGKCEAMIKQCATRPCPTSLNRAQPPQGNENTIGGEFAHLRHEAAVKRFMGGSTGAKRRYYQLAFTATVVVGILTLLAAWFTS